MMRRVCSSRGIHCGRPRGLAQQVDEVDILPGDGGLDLADARLGQRGGECARQGHPAAGIFANAAHPGVRFAEVIPGDAEQQVGDRLAFQLDQPFFGVKTQGMRLEGVLKGSQGAGEVRWFGLVHAAA